MSAPAHPSARVRHETLQLFRGRCVVAGDATVGKTCLVRLAASRGREHPKAYVCTAQAEWQSLLLRVPAAELPPGAPPSQTDLFLLDTPGGSTFNLRDDTALRLWGTCNAVLLCFDVGSRESFKNIDKWWMKARASCVGPGGGRGGVNGIGGGSVASSTDEDGPGAKGASRSSGGGGDGKPLIVALVGCKADFREAGVDRAEVSADEARALADRLKVPYFETSAERGTGVDSPFLWVASMLARRGLADDGD